MGSKPNDSHSQKALHEYQPEPEHKRPSFDDYANKLRNNDFEIENPYSQPRHQEEQPQYERQRSRGNVSGKFCINHMDLHILK